MIKTWQFLLAPLTALVISKLGKTLTFYEGRGKSITLKDAIMKSGGMPSDHSSVVVGITTIIALNFGLAAPESAISAVFAAVVLYDACHVRLANGLQGEALVKMMKVAGVKPNFQIVHGHRLIEVIIGSLIGIFAGLSIFFLARI